MDSLYEKPLGKKNYGSIPHLSNSKLGDNDYKIELGQENILTKKPRDKNDIIIVTEKYDGTNVGVCKKNNIIYPLTRSGYIAGNSQFEQHITFSNWVYENQDLFNHILNEGERITGEWLHMAIGTIYKITGCKFVAFDWFDSDNERKPFNEISSLPIRTARILHAGNPIQTEKLIDELKKGTSWAICESPEGMVYRCERNGKFDFMAKWVRSDFTPGVYMLKENKIWL